MKRFTAFDPPEYVDWSPDPDVMAGFRATITENPDRRQRIESLDDEALARLYAGMLRFRLHDIALKRWVRQGVISKAWLGTGEEAVTVGNVHALAAGDVVGPMIRNAGACHEMGMKLIDLFRAYLGTASQITRGRDLHTGDPALGVLPPISFVASLVPVMAGVALGAKMRGESRVCLTWVGDGASRTAEFHEACNLAAVQRLPLVVVLQDNGVALGTPTQVHSRAPLTELAGAYGVTGLACDGNHVLDVWAATMDAAARCRQGGGPVFLVARTFRMGGHATHDEAEARALFPPSTFDHWGRRDPVGMFETWLIDPAEPLAGGATSPEARRESRRAWLAAIEARVSAEIDEAAAEALSSRDHDMPDERSLLAGVTLTGPARESGPIFPSIRPGATGATLTN
ncbi:MAG: thiamine pyrophosphate-dependent dehydrogenase E1 component subunit alpha [Acidobacteriota bacterium]